MRKMQSKKAKQQAQIEPTKQSKKQRSKQSNNQNKELSNGQSEVHSNRPAFFYGAVLASQMTEKPSKLGLPHSHTGGVSILRGCILHITLLLSLCLTCLALAH